MAIGTAIVPGHVVRHENNKIGQRHRLRNEKIHGREKQEQTD